MKSNNPFIIRFIILCVVIVLFVMCGLFWWQDSTSAVNPSDISPQTFIVNKGEGVKSIAARLSQERLIRSGTAFYIAVKLLGIERDLQAGDFRLNKSMTSEQIAKELTHGKLDKRVTLIEGWRNEEIATKLAQVLGLPESEFLKGAREGYMFPDTYDISREATTGAVIKLFLDNFNKKVSSEIRDAAESHKLSLHDLIVLSSIVEREGRGAVDRPIIAGILLNRLGKDWPLQVDATVQYALGYQEDEKIWWKKHLTKEDKDIRSLYNTYIYSGLPPQPIANPGLDSIYAVSHPTKTEYMYYLHDESGAVHYAVTLEQHEENIRLYLGY